METEAGRARMEARTRVSLPMRSGHSGSGMAAGACCMHTLQALSKRRLVLRCLLEPNYLLP